MNIKKEKMLGWNAVYAGTFCPGGRGTPYGTEAWDAAAMI
jgi:hypothetical protein